MLKVIEEVEDKETVLKNAEAIDLTQIDGEALYIIKKTSAKNPSPYGYGVNRIFLTGKVFLVGDSKYVWLHVRGRGLHDWFRTSPIVKCTRQGENFEVETQNSIYFLEKAE